MAPSSGPSSLRPSGASPLDLSALKVPVDPDKMFLQNAQSALDQRALALKTRLSVELDNNPELVQIVEELHTYLKDESQTMKTRREHVRAQIEVAANNFLVDEPPLFADYAAAVAGTTLNAQVIERELGDQLRRDLKRIASELISEAVDKGSGIHGQTLRRILSDSSLSCRDIDQWIETAGKQLPLSDRKRLEATGLVRFDGNNPDMTTNYFRNLRNWGLGSWAVTGLVCGTAIGGAALGALGAAPASLIAAGACGANWIAHTLLRRTFEREFKGTWDEAKTELKSSVPLRATAWLGVMTKLIQECSPIIFGKNSTEWWLGAKKDALTVDAVVEHLKLAALGATAQVENPKEAYQSITDYTQKVALVEDGLAHIKSRWHGYWKASERMVGVSSAIAGGAAFLLY